MRFVVAAGTLLFGCFAAIAHRAVRTRESRTQKKTNESDLGVSTKVTLIAAVSENDVIGCNGALPWKLSNDLRRFRQTTMGHVVIVGRKTFESIGRPLDGRRLIVITRQKAYHADGVEIAHDFHEACKLARAEGYAEAFVMGGAEIYPLALEVAHRLLLTRVHAHVEGDARFPEIDRDKWALVRTPERHSRDEKNQFDYSFEELERRPTSGQQF